MVVVGVVKIIGITTIAFENKVTSFSGTASRALISSVIQKLVKYTGIIIIIQFHEIFGKSEK